MPYLGSSPARGLVGTADIDDDAVSLAKIASGIDGELLTWDSSGNPAAVAAGTSGHFLKSQGAGSVPVFAEAGGGAWTFLATATASSTTDIEWKTQFSASTYGSYKILFENTKLSATGETLQVVFSTNAGSSYDTTSGNYKDQTIWRRGNGDTGGQSASDETGINLYVKTNSGTDAEDFVSGELTIFNPSTSDITSCHVFSVGKYNDNYFYVMNGMPLHNVSADVDAIKIVTSGASSNIAVGTFRLYGLKIA